MRKQCLLTTLLFVCLSLPLLAERRSEAEARSIAAQYLNLPAKATALRRAPVTTTSSLTPYYVYNSDRGGFAVVSGSDRLPAVIGFSEQGTLNPEDPSLPSNLRYWLDYAAEAARMVEKDASLSTLEEKHYGKDYAPLLGDINFNQDYPYNKQCPRGTFTGCMATAMSQVLAYWQYPQQGRGWGSVSYNGSIYSADLSTPPFDWDNILPAYKGVSATPRQEDAVAQLHYYVGLALELHYGTDATAGVSTRYATALRENFGYNSNVCLINRDCFTYGEWIDILLGEFENHRPVLYDGVSGSGGHAFVIDGYRASDRWFHVNWGWGGHSNGYFNITLLNPASTGIGASLSSGFTSYQDAVINITPEQGVGTYYTPLFSYANGGITSSSIGKVIPAGYQADITVEYMANYTDKAFNGRYGVVIMQDGQELERIEVGTVSGRASTFDINNEVTFYGNSWMVPALPDGDYRVYVYAEQDGCPAGILHTQTSRPNYINMYMRDGKASFAMDNYYPTCLSTGRWNFQQKQMSMADNCITVDVTNSGTSMENGSFSIQFDAPHRLTQVLRTDQVCLAPGETRTLTFWADIHEYGTYKVSGLYMDRLNNGGKTIIQDTAATFTVYRDRQTTLDMLRSRLAQLQDILNNASYGNGEGEYPASARDRMQALIDAIRASNLDSMDVATLQELYDQLNAAAEEFFRQMNIAVVTGTWSYVGNATVDTGWSLGSLETPAYFGISVSASDLQAYRGCKIVGISAHFGRRTSYQDPQPEDLTTQVLLLDYYGHPGDRVLASSDNFHPTTQQYADYYFNEPYVIGDNGVTAVCKIVQHKSFYAAMAACSSVAKPGACWLNNGSGWEDIYYTYGSNASGHAIKLIIQGTEADNIGGDHGDHNGSDDGGNTGGEDDYDYDDDDDDDFDYEYGEDGLPLIKVTIPDGIELDNTIDNLYTDLLYYKRNDDTDHWQTLYVPFDMEYRRWKRDFEVAEFKEALQLDDDEDGIADRTILRFQPLAEGSSVTYNTPYLIRAKEPGGREIALPKAQIHITARNDISTSTPFARISLKGTYSPIPSPMQKGYYILTDHCTMQVPTSPDQELSPMRWYMTITDSKGKPYAPNDVSILIADSLDVISPLPAWHPSHSPALYDLSGRRIPRPTHGIVIKQGMKTAR